MSVSSQLLETDSTPVGEGAGEELVVVPVELGHEAAGLSIPDPQYAVGGAADDRP